MTRYNYNAWITAYLITITAILWALSIVVIVTMQHAFGPLLAMVAIPLMALLLSRTCLSRASIIVDDAGISAILFGITMRHIPWKSVTKIVKTRAPIGQGYYRDSFQIYGESGNPVCRFLLNICGNISFGQGIRNLRDLLDQINSYAARNAISLLVWDLEALAKKQIPSDIVESSKRTRSRTELPTAAF